MLEWVAIPFSRESSLIQGRNPGLLHGRQILHHLSHQGSPMFKVSVLKRNAPTTHDCVLQLEDAELTRTSEGRQVASGWTPSLGLGPFSGCWL